MSPIFTLPLRAALLVGFGSAALVYVAGLADPTLAAPLAGMLCALVVYVLSRHCSLLNRELLGHLEVLKTEAEQRESQDGLTGLPNRRYFDNAIDREWRRAGRSATPVSMVLADLNGFSAYTETFGRQIGDDALKLVADTLSRSALRPGDVVARYGADEFAVLLPYTDRPGAEVVARKMIDAVDALQLPAADGAAVMSICVGISSDIGGQVDADQTASTLIAMAESDLSEAKSAYSPETTDDDFSL